MILRSVMRHVRDQNWFAVGLDFVIVVVGVFIGIQVADWNEERKGRDAEQRILQRLSSEVRALIEVVQAERAMYQERADRMISAHPVLFGQEPIRELTVGECEQVGGSHVYRPPSDTLPVLEEIRESDRFDLLIDPVLRARLRDFLLFRERARAYFAESTNELFRLYNLHPDVIWIERTEREADYDGRWTFLAGEGYRWQVVCDVEGMRGSRAFLSHYADNTSRVNSLLRIHEEGVELLNAIDAALQHTPEARESTEDVGR